MGTGMRRPPRPHCRIAHRRGWERGPYARAAGRSSSPRSCAAPGRSCCPPRRMAATWRPGWRRRWTGRSWPGRSRLRDGIAFVPRVGRRRTGRGRGRPACRASPGCRHRPDSAARRPRRQERRPRARASPLAPSTDAADAELVELLARRPRHRRPGGGAPDHRGRCRARRPGSFRPARPQSRRRSAASLGATRLVADLGLGGPRPLHRDYRASPSTPISTSRSASPARSSTSPGSATRAHRRREHRCQLPDDEPGGTRAGVRRR